jgi:two-component system, LytTR family, response regulator
MHSGGSDCMTPLRAAIVDDEPLARARLRRLLAKVGGHRIDVVAECVDADELLASAADTTLDVVFLDIEMPGGDGFGALARWPGPRPQVVFVTAYAKHGARAFDAWATDYLLKPVSAERLQDTLQRVQRAHDTASPAGQGDDEGPRLPLPVGQRMHLVPTARIDLVTADGNYLHVRAGTARYTLRSTLADFLAKLEPTAFAQLHRSTIVRLAAIRDISPLGSGRFRITLHDGDGFTSGRRYLPRVRALLDGAPDRRD